MTLSSCGALCNQVGHIHGHLEDLGVVELLDFTHGAHIFFGDEVDANTLATEATTSANALNVVLLNKRQVVVDDQ